MDDRSERDQRGPDGWAFRLLLRSFPESLRPEVAELVRDEYRERRRRHGRIRARLWLWRELLSPDVVRLWRRTARPRGETRPGGHDAAGLGLAGVARPSPVAAVTRHTRHALRALRRSPGFTAVVIATLALGVGANTALFTLVDAVLLRPLPYPDSDELVAVWHTWKQSPRAPLAKGAFLALRERARSFERMTLVRSRPFNLADDEAAVHVAGAEVTPGFFGVLGVDPELGRGFLPEEGRPGGAAAVVLSHGLWRDRFGGDRDVLGRRLRIDARPYTVVGVMPAGFEFATWGTRQELWVPMVLSAEDRDDWTLFSFSVARLADGTTLGQARDELQRVRAALREEHPDFFTAAGFRPEPLLEAMVGTVSQPLWLLLGAVGLLLLVACTNVANLILARNVDRRRELALKTALGAGRGRIVGDLLAEAMILGLAAGAAGLALAVLCLDLLLDRVPVAMPRTGDVAVDARVLGFGVGLALFTALLFGLLPALRASSVRPGTALGVGGRWMAGGRDQRTRDLLVGSQVALVLVLLMAAGLLGKSFWRLSGVDPGFETGGRLVVRVEVPPERYADRADLVRFFERLEERLAALPAVESVGVSTFVPLRGSLSIQYFAEGHPRTETLGEAPVARYEAVSPGYFETLGIELEEGRLLRPGDGDPEAAVAVVSRAIADDLYPDGSALGRTLYMPGRDVEIVGIVEDVRQQGLDQGGIHQVYVPHPHLYFPWKGRHLTLKSRVAEPRSLLADVRRVVRDTDPDQAIAWAGTLEEVVAGSLARPRFEMLLLGAFAGLALSLAVVGVFGAVSFRVARRTREVGVRMALGAGPGRVRRWVLRKGLTPVLLGILAGTALALAAAPLVQSLLYEVEARDPALLLGVGALLLVSGALAAWLPARRATRVDPRSALGER